MTVYKYMRKYGIDELVVFDVHYDAEVYFDSDILNPNNLWDKSMKKLAKKLIVTGSYRDGVSINLSELIEKNIDNINAANLYGSDTTTGKIMFSIDTIFDGFVQEKWLEKFVDTLVK